MERGGQGEQDFADEIKEKPGCYKTHQTLAAPNQAGQTSPLKQGHAGKFAKAGSANDPVFVLSDAFAAEELTARWTSRYGFTRGVIEATLIGQVLHQFLILIVILIL